MEDILASIRRILSEDEAQGATPANGNAPVSPPPEPPRAEPPKAEPPKVEPPRAEAPKPAPQPEVFALDHSMLVEESPKAAAVAPHAKLPDPPPRAASSPASAPQPAQQAPMNAFELRDFEGAISSQAHAAVADATSSHLDRPNLNRPESSMQESPSGFASPSTPADGHQPQTGSLVAPEAAAAASSHVGSLLRKLSEERAAVVHRGGPSIEDIIREEMRPMLKAWLDNHLPGIVERHVRTEIEKVVSQAMT